MDITIEMSMYTKFSAISVAEVRKKYGEILMIVRYPHIVIGHWVNPSIIDVGICRNFLTVKSIQHLDSLNNISYDHKKYKSDDNILVLLPPVMGDDALLLIELCEKNDLKSFLNQCIRKINISQILVVKDSILSILEEIHLFIRNDNLQYISQPNKELNRDTLFGCIITQCLPSVKEYYFDQDLIEDFLRLFLLIVDNEHSLKLLRIIIQHQMLLPLLHMEKNVGSTLLTLLDLFNVEDLLTNYVDLEKKKAYAIMDKLSLLTTNKRVIKEKTNRALRFNNIKINISNKVTANNKAKQNNNNNNNNNNAVDDIRDEEEVDTLNMRKPYIFRVSESLFHNINRIRTDNFIIPSILSADKLMMRISFKVCKLQGQLFTNKESLVDGSLLTSTLLLYSFYDKGSPFSSNFSPIYTVRYDSFTDKITNDLQDLISIGGNIENVILQHNYEAFDIYPGNDIEIFLDVSSDNEFDVLALRQYEKLVNLNLIDDSTLKLRAIDMKDRNQPSRTRRGLSPEERLSKAYYWEICDFGYYEILSWHRIVILKGNIDNIVSKTFPMERIFLSDGEVYLTASALKSIVTMESNDNWSIDPSIDLIPDIVHWKRRGFTFPNYNKIIMIAPSINLGVTSANQLPGINYGFINVTDKTRIFPPHHYDFDSDSDMD